MLFELIMDLLTAGDAREKEKIYRRLERVGVDRRTADALAAEFYKEQGVEAHGEKAVRCTHR